MPIRTTKKKHSRATVSSDQLSPDKVRISVAVPRSLRQKLEKLAKIRHVTLSGCVVGLLETAYEDSLAVSEMMGDPEVRHAIMFALDHPNVRRSFKDAIFPIVADEQDAYRRQYPEELPEENIKFDVIDTKKASRKK